MTQIWLFASCILLLLTEGDAVFCRQCSTMRPWIPCRPPWGRCPALPNEDLCMTMKVFKDFELWQVVQTCSKINNPKCGDFYFDDMTGKMYVYSCCSNKNFCNDSQ